MTWYTMFCTFSIFFIHAVTPEIYTLSLHDALPICDLAKKDAMRAEMRKANFASVRGPYKYGNNHFPIQNFYLQRSEEHTSELQSHSDLVCRLLLEKKKRS